MADHASAIKQARKAKKRHARNQLVLTSLKTLVKKMNTALASKQPEEAKALLVKTTSAFDRAVTKGIVHRNTASRKISRLTLKVQKGLSAQKSA
jgi:small subunit ribosomal protein S20